MPDDRESTPSHRPLSLEIRAATREKHSALNRLINPRICLCLPPSTQTTHLYVFGLTIFGNIYSSFEREWLRILDRAAAYPSRMVEILRTMHIPELLRSGNLRHELSNVKLEVNNKTWQKASSMMQAYRSAIRASIRSKPHTLLAYMWVSYMALFNGGRMIRDQLAAAPLEFWQCSQISSDSEESRHVILTERLQFWYFGSDDGQAIKEDFKKRFDVATARLTASECVEVVDEAVRIFGMFREMVDWLDTNAQTKVDANQASRDANPKAGLDADQDSTEQWTLQRRQGHSAVALLLLGIRHFVWGIFLFMHTYFFGGENRHGVETRKTTAVERDADTPGRS